MKLSVIIVSYKVPYFLEQTLLSVRKAAERVSTEVIVVDNNSKDNSVDLVRAKFPEVKLIANTQNTGFATANNQGIAIAKGKYILFLNPDTVVREDTFEKTIDFMERQPQAGGLGVKMIDGTGVFLPESKRGFPSPAVAFYKIFGLSKLFPKSKRFNHYHLGYLDKEQTHEVDVLSGAFMLMPRAILDQIGYWDEAFFMYGEDIDLSYRVIKAGYKNYYYADTTIIHYKGESTKKGSLNYVKAFYEAMIIFTQKHFQGSKAGLFVIMLQFAIYFRAFLTLLSNFTKKGFLFVLDTLVVYGGMLAIKNIWAQIRFQDAHYYDSNPTLIYFNFPFYVIMWLFAVYLRGGYDKHARVGHVLTGVLLGTVCITSIYAFFPQELRSSRMLILLGALWTIIAAYFNRSIVSLLQNNTLFWSESIQRNVIIVGEPEESQRVLNLLYQAHVNINFIGTVTPYEEVNLDELLGQVQNLEELVHVYKVNELIFCGKDISFEQIIYWMTKLGTGMTYKIVPEDSVYIIGSNSKNSAGDLYAVDISFNIANSIQQRNKQVLDIVYSLIFLLLSPILLVFVQGKIGFLKNIVAVLFRRKTWVGYSPSPQNKNLPSLLTAVLTPLDTLEVMPTEPQTLHRVNLFYAKDYSSNMDLSIISKAWRKLGRQKLPIYIPNTND
ncbi:glycosyltransferase family 2 protein [Aureispira anguillae]|uniref:Glycosyltransferase family 2 protein n=1 Tax=Aureispira anguillae TaxID=2864201 RepID=A0A915YJ04_9BACT|nr:glycosyltransferase family 2 protein [Aureispira anguillae]BDS13728.1 glycosyltransferase family 2 protein [Aureispira anguillae]